MADKIFSDQKAPFTGAFFIPDMGDPARLAQTIIQQDWPLLILDAILQIMPTVYLSYPFPKETASQFHPKSPSTKYKMLI